MTDKNISLDPIELLIEKYWAYERECMNGAMASKDAPTNRSRASLYRTVIGDLERLLPRKSIADIPPKERGDCLWREARNRQNEQLMIIRILNLTCRVIREDGSVTDEYLEDIIPLMDKPRGFIPWVED